MTVSNKVSLNTCKSELLFFMNNDAQKLISHILFNYQYQYCRKMKLKMFLATNVQNMFT